MGSAISLTAARRGQHDGGRHHEPDEAPRPHPESGDPAEKPGDRTRAPSRRRRRAHWRGGTCGHRLLGSLGSSGSRHDSSARLERVAEAEIAGGWWERRSCAGGQRARLATPDERADLPAVLRQHRSGARADQHADRGAGEPGHQREGDTEESELGFVVRHHPGHPDRGRECEHGQRDAGDHAGSEKDPGAHFAQEQEPGGEPPQARCHRQGHESEEPEADRTAEGVLGAHRARPWMSSTTSSHASPRQ